MDGKRCRCRLFGEGPRRSKLPKSLIAGALAIEGREVLLYCISSKRAFVEITLLRTTSSFGIPSWLNLSLVRRVHDDADLSRS